MSACRDDCSRAEGRAEPASAALSPVARDYPSPRFRSFFQTTVRLAVLSRNDDKGVNLPLKSHGFLLHNLFTGGSPVNKLGAIWGLFFSR
jgi:hypothetical protein